MCRGYAHFSICFGFFFVYDECFVWIGRKSIGQIGRVDRRLVGIGELVLYSQFIGSGELVLDSQLVVFLASWSLI